MRKFFFGLGIAFAVLILAGGIGFGVLAYKGSALDTSSQAYVDESVVAIANTWNADELWKRSGPRLRKSTKEAALRDMIDGLRVALGPMAAYDGSKGQALMSYANSQSVTSAEYVARAHFQKGDAEVTVMLVKSGDAWTIEGFHVSSPALVKSLIGVKS
jgi:hypothetical protein